MALREILTEPNKILREKSLKVEQVDKDLQTLMDDMLETMYAAPGIGLAAIQVGVPKRILVIDIARDDEARNPLSFINPEIIDPTESLNSFEEGCLSVPGVFEEIERPDECTVKYLDKDGVEQSVRCKGMLATVIQHEMDHLNGVVFVDHLSKLKRDRAIKKSIKSRNSETNTDE